MTTQFLDCPRHMEYGRCGGVEFDGTCEVRSAEALVRISDELGLAGRA